MRIITDNFDSLVESFGASRRLATRVGALARKGLYVSETLLEVALEADSKPLHDLLLSKALLDAAGALDADALGKLTADAFFEEVPVALRRHDSRRVLCLAEEIDEAPETADPAETDAGSTLATMEQGSPAAIIRPDEARKLLGDDEVSRLKMDLVTSAESARRLEAVRKLYLSKLPRDDKLRLFLTALRDRDSDVRAEAARALGGLGVDGALTENLARASQGGTPERVIAVTNLSRILPRLSGAQQQLGVALLLEFVTPGEEREVVLATLGVLSGVLTEAPEGGTLLPKLQKRLLELLQTRQADYEDAARKLFGTLFKLDRDGISGLLVQSLDELGQRSLRYFVLSLLTENNLEAAAAPPVVAQLIEGLCTGNELDRNFQACSAALARLGDRAVGGLLDALEEANDAGKERIIDLLGHLLRVQDATEFPLTDKAAGQVVQACLELYPQASPEVCTALLESGFYTHAALQPQDRATAVRAFIDSLHEFRFERQVELVQTALARCGHEAVQPLRDAMLESAHDVTRSTAARLLPEVIEDNAEVTAEELADLVSEIRGVIDSEDHDFPAVGALYVALGRIGAHGATDAAAADELAEYLRERVGRSSSVYDILEALGWIAAGASLSRNQRLETGYLLLNVLKKGLPTMSGRLRVNAEGEQVLHFGRETTAYTDMIPRILEGLGRMLEAERTPAPLFTSIVQDLMKLWDEITSFRRIWAPAATITLARLLGAVALGERRSDETADEIADLLSRKLILLPVMQVLSRLAMVDRPSPRMDLIAHRAFHELSKRLNEDPAPEVTERRQILETMAAIACRESLGERERDLEQARNITVEALFDAMRDKLMQARGMLEKLADSPAIPENLSNGIRRRLKPGSKRD
jgi:HEAT repeat protein